MILKKWIMLTPVLLSLILLGGVIGVKERLLGSEKILYLKLVPVDPRSILQGDYMNLRYELARKVPESELVQQGTLVIYVDELGIGHYLKMDDGNALQVNQLRLNYKYHGEFKLGAENYFFQEGSSHCLELAEYAELRVNDDGDSLLVGLRDHEMRPLGTHLLREQWFITMPNSCD